MWQLAAPVDDFGKMTGFFAAFAENARATDQLTQSSLDRDPTLAQEIATWSDGSIMRGAFAMAATAISLAGCSSFSGGDYLSSFKSPPPEVRLQLESTPSGAEARTSLGPGCKTPCSVSVTPADGMTSFLVNYSMPGRQPAGVPVNIVKVDGGMFSSNTVKLEPNPVVTELQPIGPPPKPARPVRPKRKKPAAAPADAEPAAVQQ